MPERLQNITQNIKSRWDALTKQQRIRLISAVAVVILALVLTIYLTVRTQYTDLANNLTPSGYIQMDVVLTNAGYKHRGTNHNTTMQVDKKRFADAYVEVSVNPELAAEAFTFADALSASGMSTTETTKRQALIRAKQYELRQFIEGMNGVNSAVVELAIPESTRFIQRTSEKASASVRLDSSPRILSRAEGAAIARLVSNSVEGLDAENVEVIDTNFNILYSGSQENSITGAGTVTEMREQEMNQKIKEIRNLFQTLFSEVQPALNLVYDNVSAEDIRTYTLTPPVNGSSAGVPLIESNHQQSVQGANNPEMPGLDSNDNQSPDYQTGGNDTYKGTDKENEVTYGYNEEERVVSSGPGSYIRQLSSAAVILYRYRIYDQYIMMQRDNTLTQTDWEDFKDTTNETAVTDDPNLELYAQHVMTATGIPRDNISIDIIEVPIFQDYEATPFDIQQIIMFAVLALLILMLAFGLIRRTKPEEEEEEIEPELSVEDLLVSTQLEEAKEEMEKLEEIDYFKDSEVKRQIEKFVNEKPDAVAQLLRNWLNTNEEW